MADTKRHEAVYLNGRKINFSKPPRPNTRVMWTKRDMYGRKVTGSFRTICWLNRLNNLSIKKFGTGIVIIQPPYNTTVSASAGTHDFDACVDCFIPGVGWWDQQWFFRVNGSGAFYRYPPLFGNHIHMFCLPEREGRSLNDDYKVHGFKVGKYVDGGYSTSGHEVTSSQLEDYYEHKSALSGHSHDPSKHPDNIEATIFDLNKYVRNRARKRAA